MAPQGLPNSSCLRSSLVQLNKTVPIQSMSQSTIPLDIFAMKAADKLKLMCAHIRKISQQGTRVPEPELAKLVAMIEIKPGTPPAKSRSV